MPSVRIAVFLCFAVIAFAAVHGAPHSSKLPGQNLEQSFVEFLHQDKELNGLIQKYGLSDAPGLTRHVRQVEDVEPVEQQDGEEPNKEGGFFDRAAKFVMEVLQRFLKWINSDN